MVTPHFFFKVYIYIDINLFLKKMEVQQQIFTIIITLLTVLTSTAAWKFYEKKLQIKQKEKEENSRDGKLYRDELRERIVKLETLLSESSKEKDKMRENIILLTAQISKLEVEVDFLRKDNEMLRVENTKLRAQL